MADKNYAIAQDLKEAQAMVDGLDNYVRHDQLYGSIGGLFSGGNMPSLTIGALLMRLRRLYMFEAQMSGEQRGQLEAITHKHETVRKEWRLHYDAKMLREANSRLDAMAHFFEECSSDPRLCARVYLPEVQRRTVVEEILIAMRELGMEDAELSKKVRGVDGRLRRFTQPAPFVWDSALKPVYSETQFWWMYSHPPLEVQ